MSWSVCTFLLLDAKVEALIRILLFRRSMLNFFNIYLDPTHSFVMSFTVFLRFDQSN